MVELARRLPSDRIPIDDGFLSRERCWRAHWLLVGVVGVALALFLWELAAPSLFIDEVYSWRAAAGGVGELLHRVRVDEIAPPTYYLLLHGWIHAFGSDNEWVMRLPSVLAGVGLVATTYWLGGLLGGRWAAALSGLLAAISPLVLQYSQEARAYVFATFTVALAVAAAVQAARSARPARWLVLSAVAAVAAMLFHYIAVLVVLPLEVWVWLQRGFLPRARRGHLAAVILGFVAVLPWFALQVHRGHQGGVAPFARLTIPNLLAVLGTPFDPRYPQAIGLRWIAAATVCLASGLLATRAGRGVPARWLLFSTAAFPVLFVAGLTAFAEIIGQSTYTILISRYSAVAAPFMLVAIALMALRINWGVALLLLVAVAVVAVISLAGSYQQAHFWTDLRDPFATASAGYKTGDVIELSGYANFHEASDYYLARILRRRPAATVIRVPANQPAVAPPAAANRIWVVSDPAAAPASTLKAVLRRLGYHMLSLQTFTPSGEVALAATTTT